MTIAPGDQIRRLQLLLASHAAYSWDDSASELVERLALHVLPLSGAGTCGAGLYIPSNLPFDPSLDPVVEDCFGIEMPMLHPLDPDNYPDFRPIEGMRWVWRNVEGGWMLAFNVAGAVDHLLYDGHCGSDALDRHGRPFSCDTILGQKGLLAKPVINIYLLAILSVAKALAEGGTEPTNPRCHVLPPIVILSHDCDQLRGDDFFTQAARLYRFLAPLKKLRMPAWANLRHLIANVLSPKKYYFHDALRMLQAEKNNGFRSAFYFLNGVGGRFGARTSEKLIAEFVAELPRDVEIGIHYNYKFSSNITKLQDQKNRLEEIVGTRIQSGRAHYLAFDPSRDFPTLAEAGVLTDESIGFSNCNSFRVGLAGAYRIDKETGAAGEPIVEIPLHFMDTNMAVCGDEFDVLVMAAEVEKVGGVISILYHPGSYQNPEHDAIAGLYDHYLEAFNKRGYRNMLPCELGDLVRQAHS